MLVCHCKAVSDRTIRRVVRSGAATCRQVGRDCQAGRSCGGCQPLIREIIDDEREDRFAESGDLVVAAG